MKLSIEGDEATGKSTLAYTAPTPIVGFCFDLGSERAIYGSQFNTWFKDKRICIQPYTKDTPEVLWTENDITVYELPQPIQLDSTKMVGLRKQWDYFVNLFAKACMDDRVQTIVIDTMTLARRIKADAYLEELQVGGSRKQLLQIEWGHANDAIRDLYTLAGGSRKNLVAIHHLTDERKDGIDKDGAVVSMVTGGRVLEGLSQTYRYVDVALRMENNKGLVGMLKKVGYNLDLQGMPIQNPSWNSIVKLIMGSLENRISIGLRE